MENPVVEVDIDPAAQPHVKGRCCLALPILAPEQPLSDPVTCASADVHSVPKTSRAALRANEGAKAKQ